MTAAAAMSDPSSPRPGTLTVTIDQQFSKEAEQRAIGLVIQWPKTWADFQRLDPVDFFDPVHASVWGCIHDLKRAAQPSDLTAVVMQMAGKLGGMQTQEAQDMAVYLTACVTRAVALGPQNYQDTARLLTSQADKRAYARQLVEAAQKLSRSSLTDTAPQLASEHIRKVQTVQRSGSSLITASELVREIREDRLKPVMIDSTGWPRLDRALGGGFARNEYSVFAGRMGSFKTTLATSVSYNLVNRPSAVFHDYYCLEQTGKQIFHKILAHWISEHWFEKNGLVDRVNANVFRDADMMSQPWFNEACEEAEEWFLRRGLRFLRRPRMDLNDLVSEITSAGLEGHARGIIIDYAQLIRTPLAEKGMTTAHLDHVHQTLAELATNNPLWILALAQMNQTGGVRGGEGALAAASNVAYIHKVEVPDEDPEEPCSNEVWIEFEKNRLGAKLNVGGSGETDDNGRRLPPPAYRLVTESGPYLMELPRPNR